MIAITGGTVVTVANGTLANATILVEGDQIVDIGERLPLPEGAEVIDASGKVVTPGLIDAHCHVGVTHEGSGFQYSNDFNEMSDPITPHCRAVDSIYPQDAAFPVLRAAGVTAVMTTPGSANLIGGEAALIHTRGDTVSEMVIEAPTAMKMALGDNPKGVFGIGQNKAPYTRMGNAAVLRQALTKAQGYKARKEAHARKLAAKPDETDPFEIDLRWEAMLPVLEGKLMARIHAHLASDIMVAIQIAEEFGLRYAIEHATEGFLVADELARRDVPVFLGPIMWAVIKKENVRKKAETAAMLANKGVRVSIITDDVRGVAFLAMNAGIAVQGGMSSDDAFRAITLTPAEVMGVADRIGSLEAGKLADLVVYDRHPFDSRARALLTMMAGEIVHRG